MIVLEFAVGQILALVAFFAFPAGQYIILKTLSHKEGRPELWYLPDYGFRLVIRNLPRRKVLTDIKYSAFMRRRIPASEGASVATFDDLELLHREDMVLFPGTDQVLVCFRGASTDGANFSFVHTDKLGNEQQVVQLDPSARLVCDYSAVVQNFFNFNIVVAKRIEIKGESLISYFGQATGEGLERSFGIDRVRTFS